ncbi:MAG: YqgE/AlgH family protein [Bacteroidetes bacterium]|nr:YqgE/AlgH family protein [Bacteroidota bacterium]
MNFVDINMPVNKIAPSTGKLLVAEPFLNDPNFARSVILLCEHGEEGSVGFILNHATELTLGDLLPEMLNKDIAVYQGGPVQMDTLHMLHRMPEKLGGTEIIPGIYWGGSYDALQDIVLTNDYKPDDLRLFVGYAGWSKDQLSKELDESSWIIIDAKPGLLFETEPKDVWKEAIRTLGKEYAFIENMPVNPLLN